MPFEQFDPTQDAKGGPMKVDVPNIDVLLQRDSYLKPFEREIRRRLIVSSLSNSLHIKSLILTSRYGNFEDILKHMTEVEGGIENMSLGFKTFGCHAMDDGTFVARQWAPGAEVTCFYFIF